MREVAELEALLFAAGDPISMLQLQDLLDCGELEVKSLLQQLSKALEERKSALTVREVAGGFQLATLPKYYTLVERLSQVVDKRLSTPTMETLSIIAFKQPITKQEIEQIRGVRAERAVAKLLELDLIAEKGRKQVIGRPILYGTTGTFLQCFGLNTLDELPKLPIVEELEDEHLRLLNESGDGQEDSLLEENKPI